MKRRTFIAALGSAAAWPVVARAQPDRMRRLAVLMAWSETDPQIQAVFAAFKQRLTDFGWSEGNNLHIDIRWSAGDVNRAVSFARELVTLQPDVILAGTTPVTIALQHETKAIPIVFVQVSDPIGSGFVQSLSHPGGNITGFLNLEATLAEKWLEILKEITPRTKRIAIMFNPQTAPYAEYYLGPLQAMAPKLGVEVFPAPVRSDDEIEKTFSKMADAAGGGVIAMTDIFIYVHRKLIIEQAAHRKIPAISFVRDMTLEGGLVSYGVNGTDLFVRAATYIDRILRGATPADLPVQGPTKFELFISLKTAKALGLDVPPSVLARADEVIE